MQREQRIEISQAGLQLAIQEIKDDLYDTPACDYTVAKLLSHCGRFEDAEHVIDTMLLRWGSSPDVVALVEQGYADIDALSVPASISPQTPATSAALA
ncbi:MULTISPECIES: hypothetical protein [unclassified Halomonas]|uniref:hypothetical protein n=1 Tax=unclassified Halomonas TaxID=2609666 RepID=UPI0006DA5113|nr:MULTISPECIES: hypothetical protein [unclassified Halomonas]KPQ28880.1 MAG: hypothetical protein HLUCCO06_15585 [Halomonas sp. HL-93]SBR50748.1 pentatricopeptide repeat domain-containing protein (PPR motif) [Halomonas sp. HL-93]SNY97016.1 pentatricopeptide repeat domain-containing protein (PPR motif) [Halomonas sp. hl-4]